MPGSESDLKASSLRQAVNVGEILQRLAGAKVQQVLKQ
jgi:hypothetical protein